jgi:dimethylhistidine N-methyltransferase
LARVEHRARPARLARAAPAPARAGRVRFYRTVVHADSFREDLIAGLSQPQKAIPPKYFYDDAGSRLFDRICRLPEYYPTRTELAITRAGLAAIARFAGAGCELIEYGSGASRKTRALIGALRPAVYLPVDISASALAGAARRLAREFDWLHIFAVAGDFTQPLRLPVYRSRQGRRRLVYFPGSTIGNFTPEDAQAFLRMTRGQVGRAGAMLVGVDLKKDANLLHAAYNDARGVTARFNLNLLARANRELGADFDLRRFRHYAFYNPARGRIEMHLVSLARQAVSVGEHRFALEPGETIHTENSYKYSVEEFAALAEQAGFRAERVWRDKRGWFAVFGLVAA